MFYANIDEPWNIFENFWWAIKNFLRTFRIFLVTSFKSYEGPSIKWSRSEHKMFKLAIKKILKNKAFLKITKIHSSIWHMLIKINFFFDVFWNCCCGIRHYNGKKYIYYDNFSWGFFICLTPFFIDSLDS